MDEEEAKAIQAGAPKKQRGKPRKLAPIRTMRDALAEWIAEEQRPVGQAVWTGFPTIDASLGKPFRLGEVIQIAARTSVGKSFFVQHLVEWALAADPDAYVVGFPLEMPAFQMAERHAARALGVDPAAAAKKAAAGEITPAEVVQRNPALERIVMYEAGTKASDLPHVVEKAAEHFERWPTIVYVDYFGLLGKEDPRAPRYEAASDNARMLKEVAKDVKCVVLCAAQLSRQGGRDGTAPPTLDSLRDSGVIEEAADRVLALWRDEEGEGVADVRNEIRIKVLKNRFGPAGAQALLRFSSTLALEEVDEYAAGSPF